MLWDEKIPTILALVAKRMARVSSRIDVINDSFRLGYNSEAQMTSAIEDYQTPQLQRIKDEFKAALLQITLQVSSDLCHCILTGGDIRSVLSSWMTKLDRALSKSAALSFRLGRVSAIRDLHGADVRLVQVPGDSACAACKALSVDSDGNTRHHSLAELEANGTNLGRPRSAWLPTLEPHHPGCRCDLKIHKSETYLIKAGLDPAFVGSQYGDRAVVTGTSGPNIAWGVPRPNMPEVDYSSYREAIQEYVAIQDMQPRLLIDPSAYNFRQLDKVPTHPVPEWQDRASFNGPDAEYSAEVKDWVQRWLDRRAGVAETGAIVRPREGSESEANGTEPKDPFSKERYLADIVSPLHGEDL